MHAVGHGRPPPWRVDQAGGPGKRRSRRSYAEERGEPACHHREALVAWPRMFYNSSQCSIVLPRAEGIPLADVSASQPGKADRARRRRLTGERPPRHQCGDRLSAPPRPTGEVTRLPGGKYRGRGRAASQWYLLLPVLPPRDDGSVRGAGPGAVRLPLAVGRQPGRRARRLGRRAIAQRLAGIGPAGHPQGDGALAPDHLPASTTPATRAPLTQGIAPG